MISRKVCEDHGIELQTSGNTIGGTSAAARNVISGNTANGIRLTNSDNNFIQGNYIGTNAAGTAGLASARPGPLAVDFAWGEVWLKAVTVMPSAAARLTPTECHPRMDILHECRSGTALASRVV